MYQKKKFPDKKFPRKKFPEKILSEKNSQKKFSNGGVRRAPSFAAERLQPSAGARKKPPVGGLNFLVYLKAVYICYTHECTVFRDHSY